MVLVSARRVGGTVSALAALVLGFACTHDFNRFHEGAGGLAGETGGTSGASNGGSSAAGTSTGGGANGGASSGGTGGSGASATGGSGTAGSTGTGGSAGSSSGGSAGAPACTGNDISCSGTCTDVTTSTTHCGSCGNNCTLQGKSTGFFCQASICWCTSDAQCRGGSGTLGTDVACDETSGQCQCGTALNHCNFGEICIKSGAPQVCSCNARAACPAGQTCCYRAAASASDTGCANLQTDSANCGACGHACGTGTTCQSGQCLP